MKVWVVVLERYAESGVSVLGVLSSKDSADSAADEAEYRWEDRACCAFDEVDVEEFDMDDRGSTCTLCEKLIARDDCALVLTGTEDLRQWMHEGCYQKRIGVKS